MKKVTAFLLVLALLLCNPLLVNATAPEGDVLVDVAYVGEEGLVELTIRTEIAAAAGNFTVTYDNRAMTFLEMTPDTDYSSVKTDASTVSCSYVNRPAKAGTLAVLRFSYDAETAGTTKVNMGVTVIDENETTTQHTKSLVLELASRETLCPSAAFADLSMDAWYHDATDYVIANGIMNGVSQNLFHPNGTTTRAMFVTILGRSAGVDIQGYGEETSFTDVPAGTWYSAYVNWASEKGIVNGRGDGTFCPQDPVTRQEMVTILARFAGAMGQDTTVENTDVLNSFADADEIAAYATEAFAWAVEQGIINGTDTGLAPRGPATRAQAAQILCRFWTN